MERKIIRKCMKASGIKAGVDTFHIAIGSNTMFGGTNEGNIHLDMIGLYRVKE